jgi:subtilisin family serine protease
MGVCLALFLVFFTSISSKAEKPQSYLVGYDSTTSMKDFRQRVFQAGLSFQQNIAQLKVSVVSGTAAQLTNYYRFNQKRIRYIEPNYPVRITDSFPASNSPIPSQAKDLWAMKAINAPDAWAITQGDSKIIVAITDTGTFTSHPDLKPSLWSNSLESGKDTAGKNKSKNKKDDDGNGFVDDVNGWNFHSNNNNIVDNHYHGTHVAGTIGAATSNNQGIMGVGLIMQSEMPLKWGLETI